MTDLSDQPGAIPPISSPPVAIPVESIWAVDDSSDEQEPVTPNSHVRTFSMPSWLVSAIVHGVALIVIGTLTVPAYKPVKDFFLAMPSLEEISVEPIMPEDFSVSEIPVDEVGALSDGDGAFEAASLAPEISELPEVDMPQLSEVEAVNPLAAATAIEIATGTDFSKTFIMKGMAGVGMKGASGAIDRLTHELLMSMEERPTLVAWLFDQSGSLNRQRQEVTQRFAAIYDEIGTVSATGVFSKFEEAPLLSTIVAFGSDVTLRTRKPTDDPEELRSAVADIEEDMSGVENVFRAVNLVVEQYHRYRSKRNIMIIIFSDEVGDDQHLLDETVDACRRYAIPVYVVGVPAPFGQVETLVKWVDPDPNFSQEPQWGRVNQGPESLLPERIQLAFADSSEYEPPIDSGFGPYALTRLCYQTGGIYFTVHPNRRTDRLIGRRETDAFSAHILKFFDEEKMRRYRPDYVSAKEYQRCIKALSCRAALVAAAQQSWIEPMDSPTQRFPANTEAEFARNLTEGQKAAAILEPRLERLYAILSRGERDRNQEDKPRWQAGFDLAIGRTLAALVRTRMYNTMLADAKRGLTSQNEKTNVWLLKPSDTIEAGSELKRMAEQARAYLQRVNQEHAGTPWAALARRELKFPLGWTWSESYVEPPAERRMRMAQNNNMMPRDEQRRMLEKQKPRRQVPRL